MLTIHKRKLRCRKSKVIFPKLHEEWKTRPWNGGFWLQNQYLSHYVMQPWQRVTGLTGIPSLFWICEEALILVSRTSHLDLLGVVWSTGLFTTPVLFVLTPTCHVLISNKEAEAKFWRGHPSAFKKERPHGHAWAWMYQCECQGCFKDFFTRLA